MIFPTIHSGGDTAATLLWQLEAAYSALADVIGPLADARPNARNYYVQGPDAYYAARDEFAAHEAAINAARDYIMALYEHVDAIAAERARK